jgi:hypothetical protein
LISPANNSLINNTDTISFVYNVSDFSTISSCSLIIGSSSYQTNSSITRNINQTFYQELGANNYTWSINCTDLFGNVGVSNLFNFTMGFNDSYAPIISINSPSNGTVTAINSIVLIF